MSDRGIKAMWLNGVYCLSNWETVATALGRIPYASSAVACWISYI